MYWINKFCAFCRDKFYLTPKLSLRLRVALSYAVLYLITTTALFAGIYFVVESLFFDARHREVDRFLLESEKRLLLGSKIERYNDILNPKILTDSALITYMQNIPDLHIMHVCRRRGNNGESDTLIGYSQGKYIELWQDNEGQVQIKKIIIDTNYNNLKRYFYQLQSSRGGDNTFLRYYDAKGNILFSTKIPRKFKRNPKHPDFFLKQRQLPNGEIIEAGENIAYFRTKTIVYSVLFFSIMTCVTIVGGVVGWVVSRKFIQGVGEVTIAAKQISTGDYKVRINNPYPDSEIRELVDMFNNMIETTERLMNELRMVTDNVAHDLRTPLTRMSGRIELALTDRSGNTDYREVCIAIARECDRMKNLVNTILEISRNTSNPGALQLVSVDFCDMISELHELMFPLASDKELDLKLIIPEYPVYIQADLVKVQRVASNLLENALKFTPEGGSVTLSIEDLEDRILFKVIDTGVGIAEDEQKHVFERFFRSDSSRSCLGNGLGLALVRSIVKAHKWDITLTSSLGNGSTFTVIIPKNLVNS